MPKNPAVIVILCSNFIVCSYTTLVACGSLGDGIHCSNNIIFKMEESQMTWAGGPLFLGSNVNKFQIKEWGAPSIFLLTSTGGWWGWRQLCFVHRHGRTLCRQTLFNSVVIKSRQSTLAVGETNFAQIHYRQKCTVLKNSCQKIIC